MLIYLDLELTAIQLSPSLLESIDPTIGSLADQVKEADIFDYEDIPNFPVSTVEGHKGR